MSVGPEFPETPLSIAYSPCPNDTFVFHAWAHGLIPGAPPIDVTFADIDITNGLLGNGRGLDVMKISYAALPDALEEYELLPCGGALGRGCGPLVLVAGHEKPGGADGLGGPIDSGPIDSGLDSEPALPSAPLSAPSDSLPSPLSAADLAGRTVAVPSLKSTAYLLFQRWVERELPGGTAALGEVRVLPFHEIMPAVRAGTADAGLVIHEARFTYPGFGLTALADLGEWWEQTTGAPIPLGAIVARRSLGAAAIAQLTEVIRASVKHAFAHPEASRAYVMAHAQEMDPEVAKAHIGLYVNEFTVDLGPEGLAAVELLLNGYASS